MELLWERRDEGGGNSNLGGIPNEVLQYTTEMIVKNVNVIEVKATATLHFFLKTS
jgi:hypothetical protein